MDQQIALAIWNELFGEVEVAYDFASHPMKKNDYQNESSYYGWDIDFKMPNNYRHENFIPCSLNTIRYRNHKNSFKVGNHMFEVRRGPSYGTFSIFDITDRQHPMNMDPNSENQNPEFNRTRFHAIATNESVEEEKFVPSSEFRIPTLHSINTNVFNKHLENADLGVEVTYVDDEEETPVAEPVPEEKVEEKNEKSLQEVLTQSLEENETVQEPIFTPVNEELENPWQEEKKVTEEDDDDAIVIPVPNKENQEVIEKEETSVEEAAPEAEPALEEKSAEEQPVEETPVTEEATPAEEVKSEPVPEEAPVEEPIEELKPFVVIANNECFEHNRAQEEENHFVEDKANESIPKMIFCDNEHKKIETPEYQNKDTWNIGDYVEPVVEETSVVEPVIEEKEPVVEEVKEEVVESQPEVVEPKETKEDEGLKNRITELEKKLADQENDFVQLKNKSEELNQEKENLLAQKNNLQALKENFVLRISQLDEIKEKLTSERDNALVEKQKVTDERDDFEKDKIYLQSQLDNQLINQNANNASLIGATNALKERINTLSNDNESQKEEISNLKEEKENLDNELSVTKEANADLSNQLNMVQNENLSLMMNKEDNERKIQGLEEKVNQDEQLIAQLKQQNEVIPELTEKSQNAFRIEAEKNNLQALKDTFADYIQELIKKEDSLVALNHEHSLKLDEVIAEKEKLQNQLDALQNQDKELNANYNQLDAQSQMVDDQLASLSSENFDLRKEIDDLRAEHSDLLVQFQNQSIELEHYQTSYEQIKQANNKAQSELEVSNEDKARIEARNAALNQQLAEKQNIINDKDTKIAQIQSDAERENKEKFQQILTLTSQCDDQANHLLYLSLNGCPENYLNVVKVISDRSMVFNEENIKQILKEYPEWKVTSINELNENVPATEVSSEDVSYLNKEKERREKAINYYIHCYHGEKSEVTDFAGRTIALTDYNDKNSEKGWDYCLYDNEEMESQSNVFVANLKTIRDYKKNEVFTSNGHSYHYVNENDIKQIESADYVTNPYDFEHAIKISQLNKEKTSPLVYIFVKCTAANVSESSPKDISDYFDIMDRTAKRCCPISFIEMKTYVGNGKGNYAFLTFDGSIEECYSEVLEYAMLLNSYRREFKKQGLFNAIIVVNEVNVPYSKRHLDLDTLIKESNDVELRALNYAFNMLVIDSTIKRTIHIGPSIVDKLPLSHEYLQPSHIGQGNFAQIYRFNKEFKTYNVVYNLNEN